MCVYISLFLSFIPSFLFCQVILLVLFYQFYFLFYFWTRLYIHIAQNSKGIKGDAVKSHLSTLFFSRQILLPKGNQCHQILVYLPGILFTLFLHNWSISRKYTSKIRFKLTPLHIPISSWFFIIQEFPHYTRILRGSPITYSSIRAEAAVFFLTILLLLHLAQFLPHRIHILVEWIQQEALLKAIFPTL